MERPPNYPILIIGNLRPPRVAFPTVLDFLRAININPVLNTAYSHSCSARTPLHDRVLSLGFPLAYVPQSPNFLCVAALQRRSRLRALWMFGDFTSVSWVFSFSLYSRRRLELAFLLLFFVQLHRIHTLRDKICLQNQVHRPATYIACNGLEPFAEFCVSKIALLHGQAMLHAPIFYRGFYQPTPNSANGAAKSLLGCIYASIFRCSVQLKEGVFEGRVKRKKACEGL
ncbi:hypothetical protein CC78DRAFT_353887 [Lojkania enalia]|uniref:Uncharacterized protein n=1 Tax=Lojkania enalia TaxID=147567 RepID=A0A9P4KHM5_9PLEO|nr:hypothetical protein CC78DRAFT_353887 [Didymosphaeria enalia]